MMSASFSTSNVWKLFQQERDGEGFVLKGLFWRRSGRLALLNVINGVRKHLRESPRQGSRSIHHVVPSRPVVMGFFRQLLTLTGLTGVTASLRQNIRRRARHRQDSHLTF